MIILYEILEYLWSFKKLILELLPQTLEWILGNFIAIINPFKSIWILTTEVILKVYINILNIFEYILTFLIKFFNSILFHITSTLYFIIDNYDKILDFIHKSVNIIHNLIDIGLKTILN